MELIGSLLLILAVALVVAIFIFQPFLRRQASALQNGNSIEKKLDHQRSALLADRDQVLTALQELDFDNALGKVPEENYREQRALLLKKGAEALRRLDEMDTTAQPAETAQQTSVAALPLDLSVEARIEAAVAARRSDAGRAAGAAAGSSAGLPAAPAGLGGSDHSRDALEDLIASRKRERK
ncbi:MAG: hypothetical protein IH586_05490, partial [Anaerolineaceae bacterium]|nr:hypothetical protein [Anaerolineaceae bacterium]